MACQARDDELLAMNEYAIRGMQNVGLSRYVRYDTTQFRNNRGLRVIFRKLGQDEKEHWLNHFAAALTSSLVPPYNKPPWCNNCHSEIIMDIADGVTVRIGTMYKFAEKNEAGETVWKPGKAFISQISEGELAKYETFSLPASRAMETRLLCFALRNMGAPFNEFSYKLRAVMPVTPGVAAYDPVANDVRTEKGEEVPYFCTQYCMLLLQAAAYEKLRMLKEAQCRVMTTSIHHTGWSATVLSVNATSQTPNSMYRLLKEADDVRSAASRPDQRLSSVGTM